MKSTAGLQSPLGSGILRKIDVLSVLMSLKCLVTSASLVETIVPPYRETAGITSICIVFTAGGINKLNWQVMVRPDALFVEKSGQKPGEIEMIMKILMT